MLESTSETVRYLATMMTGCVGCLIIAWAISAHIARRKRRQLAADAYVLALFSLKSDLPVSIVVEHADQLIKSRTENTLIRLEQQGFLSSYLENRIDGHPRARRYHITIPGCRRLAELAGTQPRKAG